VVAERTPLLGAGIRVRPVARASGTDTDTGAADADPLLDLSADRRARLRSFVEASTDMSETVKRRILGELERDRVPARVVQGLERRMGG